MQRERDIKKTTATIQPVNQPTTKTIISTPDTDLTYKCTTKTTDIHIFIHTYVYNTSIHIIICNGVCNDIYRR
jgi:hypothetical protein